MSIISVNHVNVAYNEGLLALRDASLELSSGTICGLIGLNGSGKSTLFKTIMGFLAPLSGAVSVEGRSTREAQKAGLVAYVPQSEEVDWNFPVSVWDVVLQGRYGQMNRLRIPRKADLEIARESLEKVGMTGFKHRQIGELSGGQRKRAFLARALAQQGKVMLLDEPFGGVDATTETVIIALLTDLRAQGHTVLISTHDLDSVRGFCDAVSHSVLPGVVIAYVLNLPFAVGAFAFGLLSVISIGFIKARTRIKEDTVFTGLFALGLVLMSKVSSSVHLSHILFGDVLGISDADVWQTVIVGSATLIVVLALRKDLLLFCFDPTHARSIGLNTTFLYYALLVVLALTIVTALQTVGIILVVAMLVTPGATAYLLSDKFDRMLVIAVASSVFSGVTGTYISYFLDGATGGCIVVLQTVLFLGAFVFAPKHGVLAKRRERQRNQMQDGLTVSSADD